MDTVTGFSGVFPVHYLMAAGEWGMWVMFAGLGSGLARWGWLGMRAPRRTRLRRWLYEWVFPLLLMGSGMLLLCGPGWQWLDRVLDEADMALMDSVFQVHVRPPRAPGHLQAANRARSGVSVTEICTPAAPRGAQP